MMEKLNLAYSTKNIPIPTERNYKLQLIDKTSYLSKKKQVECYLLRHET